MIIHGGEIFITNTDGTAFVYAAKSCDINAQCEMLEVSSPQSGKWRSWLVGRCQWSVGISHLITSVVGMFPKVGDPANIYIKGEEGYAFDGYVDNPATQMIVALSVAEIYWDVTRRRFVGKKDSLYFLVWQTGYQEYLHPQEGDVFSYGGKNYVYEGGTLSPNMFLGSVIVENAKLTATKGNLAQGSLQLRGNGPLQPVAVPTSV